MFRTAVDTLSATGHEIKASDLHAMQFDPVSGRHNFLSAKDPDYFKLHTRYFIRAISASNAAITS